MIVSEILSVREGNNGSHTYEYLDIMYITFFEKNNDYNEIKSASIYATFYNFL